MAKALEDDLQRQEEIAMETVRLGIEAEAFLQSTLGRYLIDRSKLDIAKGMDELFKADPEDAKLNREIRNKIQIAKNFVMWIGETINSGTVMTQNINENDALEP